MDALLGLIIALLLFAGFIFLIHRSVKTIMVLGLVIVALFVLSALGVWQ